MNYEGPGLDWGVGVGGGGYFEKIGDSMKNTAEGSVKAAFRGDSG